jgi:alpha-tubulin suppressor-like RCC1 family protein
MVPSLLGIPITAVAASGTHTMALSSTGSVWCWGQGRYGKLGLGDTNDRLEPALLPEVKSASNSKVEFSQIYCGGNHSVAITS